jgi:hypothetical protein
MQIELQTTVAIRPLYPGDVKIERIDLMFPTPWPRIDAALEKRIEAHLRAGKGMRKIARQCGVGTGTVQRIKQEMTGPFEAAA